MWLVRACKHCSCCVPLGIGVHIVARSYTLLDMFYIHPLHRYSTVEQHMRTRLCTTVDHMLTPSCDLACKDARDSRSSVDGAGDSQAIVPAADSHAIVSFDLCADSTAMMDAALAIAESIATYDTTSCALLLPIAKWQFAKDQPDFTIMSDVTAAQRFGVSRQKVTKMIHLTPAATVFIHRNECLRVMNAVVKAFQQNSKCLTFTETVRSDEVEYKTRGGRLAESGCNSTKGVLGQDTNENTKLLNAEWSYGSYGWGNGRLD